MTEHTEIKRCTCFHCPWTCGKLVHVSDGKVVRVTNDPNHPVKPQKQPCIKSTIALDFHDHPRRVNYPLKRTGKRGEDKWERISWDKALDEIAEKLVGIKKRYGPESVFVSAGTSHGPGDWAGQRWSNIWGTPNYIYQGKNCGCVEITSECAMYGNHSLWLAENCIPKVTKCVLLWGANPAESLMGWGPLEAAKKEGCKVIVIDPRTTESVKLLADEHLKIRPGTDAALALGMLNVIIGEDLYDKEFVNDWCLGFDEVKEIAKKYPPQKASEITWIPKEQIIDAARSYATLKPSICAFGVATTQIGAGASIAAVLGKCALRAIVGNLDVEGGHWMAENYPEGSIAWHDNMHFDMLINHPVRKRDTISSDKFPIGSVRAYALYREAVKKAYPTGTQIAFYWIGPAACSVWKGIVEEKPYPIKAMISQGGNPQSTLGNTREIVSAMMHENLELSVCHELVWTPTAQLADYVLPAADWMERPHLPLFWGHMNFYTGGKQAVEPLYERKDDYMLWREIGVRVGQKEFWPDTLEKMYDRFLKPTGMTFHELVAKPDPWDFPPKTYKKYEKTGFGTFSGKVELAPTLFEKLGYPSKLMDHKEPARSPVSTPELATEYPLILITGSRIRIYHHTQFRDQERLKKIYPYPLLMINPQTAGELEISDGDEVYIETPDGRIRQKAKVTEDIIPGVVHADGFWTYPDMPGKYPCLYGVFESGSEALVPNSPEFFNATGEGYYRALLCRVYKAKMFS